MKLKISRISFAGAIACLLLFSACNRDRQEWDGELTSTIDNNFADSEFNAIRSLVDTEGTADSTIFGKTTSTEGVYCPTSVATVNIISPTSAELTIDFGTGSNCLDGRLRTGKLHATFNGKWKDAGSTVVITPEGYTVAGYAFSFISTVTVNGRDGNGDLSWTTDVQDAVLTHPTSGTIRWEGTRTTTWIEGEGSFDANTYVYEVTGSANGTARNGLTFTAQVEQPLRVELSCRYIVGGVWSVTPQDREKRSVDYGNTGCDNQAILSVGTFSTVLTLP
ncbi:MAG TPA: hypothetical protein VHS96_02605 [Bacteroidia bacterium]|nr:hypothetical protein [Bacteroidia bacterium]